MKRIVCCLTLVLALGCMALSARAQQPAAAPAKADSEVAGMLKTILDNQRILDTKLGEIQRRLDSMSRFLGDQGASTFDTVDRRLRDIEDEVKDRRR